MFRGEAPPLSALHYNKGVDWKVAIARYLRGFYHAPHRWIAEQLNMGDPFYVQSLVSRH